MASASAATANHGAAAALLSPDLIATLARLPDAPSRTRFLAEHPDLSHRAVVEQLADVVREHVRVDVHEAAALSDAAVLIAERVGTEETMARAVRAKANACWFLHDLHAAVELFDRAAELFEASGNQAEVGRTLSSSIQSHILLGEYGRALEAAERARAIFAAEGDERRLARLDINVANIFHRQDRFAAALDAYERAYEQLLPHQDVEAIGVALHNMSVCLIVLNDFERARTTYERARDHCAAAGMPVLAAQADYNIAYLYYFRGEYSRALDMLRETRLACQKSGDRYHAALCHLDQSDIYLELNLSTEASETAASALTQFEALGNGYEAARSVTNLAIAAGQQREVFRALELFAQARSRFEREQNAVWPFVIDLYQALMLCNAGRYFEARRLCTRALSFFSESDLHRKTILCELLLARVAIETRELDEALAHCDRALAEAEATDAPVLDYQAYFLKGRIHEAAGNAARAYDAYQAARVRLESLRSVLWGEDLKIAFMTSKLIVYERLVDLCLQQDGGEGTAHEIFGYVEQAKSRSLRDLFVERVHVGRPPEANQSDLVRQIRALREELNWYYHRVEREQLGRDERSPDRLAQLQAQLREREQSFIRILRELPTGDRESAGLHDTTAVAPDELRTMLGGDTALVEYFAVGDRILAAALTDGDPRVVPLTTVSRVRELLRLLQFQLSKFEYGAEYLARVDNGQLIEGAQTHLQALHEELLAPLPIAGHRRWVVIPHDLLHYVPFHALFDGRSYVSESHAIAYAPSASVYALCRQRPASASRRALALGVPDRRAPFILDEVNAVARTLSGCDARIGADATTNALRQLGPACRIVHIATHGSFREDNPLFSGVRLGDSHLTVHDLYELRIPADLVTLSGCGTGLHVLAAGDELRGLTRGLLAAGARSVLVTLWNVDDRSTAAFMTTFYAYLESGVDAAAAVQQSMADLRRQYPHPYYWAPFTLVGADRAAL
jgi:CHAT domain-containing protein/tetratricopeptide (TPR) repeat protein